MAWSRSFGSDKCWPADAWVGGTQSSATVGDNVCEHRTALLDCDDLVFNEKFHDFDVVVVARAVQRRLPSTLVLVVDEGLAVLLSRTHPRQS